MRTVSRRSEWVSMGLVAVLVLTIAAFACSATDETEMTYEDAVAKMHHLAEKIEIVVAKTTRAILKANHLHKMEAEAEKADEAVNRVLDKADKVIQEAELLGIVLTRFDIEVFNEAVGAWVKFDPIHLTGSGN